MTPGTIFNKRSYDEAGVLRCYDTGRRVFILHNGTSHWLVAVECYHDSEDGKELAEHRAELLDTVQYAGEGFPTSDRAQAAYYTVAISIAVNYAVTH